MRTLSYILALFLAVPAIAAHADEKGVLTCLVPPQRPGQMDSLIRPSSAAEKARFDLAPHAAKRLSQHRLQVGWASGSHIFEDKPPYDDPSNLRWAYCGYSPALNVHLLLKVEDDLFTGVLL